jgi:hypothetical protein
MFKSPKCGAASGGAAVVVVGEGWRVEVPEDFSVDDIERDGEPRGLVGERGVGDQYGDLAGVSNSGEGDV